MICSPSDILAAFLVGRGLGTWPSAGSEWPIYVASMSDRVDQAVAIYDTAGTLDGRVQRTGETVEHPGAQVRIRALSHSAAWDKGEQLAAELDQVRRELVEARGRAFLLHAVKRATPVTLIGQEETNRRMIYTFNVRLTLSEV